MYKLDIELAKNPDNFEKLYSIFNTFRRYFASSVLSQCVNVLACTNPLTGSQFTILHHTQRGQSRDRHIQDRDAVTKLTTMSSLGRLQRSKGETRMAESTFSVVVSLKGVQNRKWRGPKGWAIIMVGFCAKSAKSEAHRFEQNEWAYRKSPKRRTLNCFPRSKESRIPDKPKIEIWRKYA